MKPDPQTSEKYIERRLVQAAKSNGGLCIKLQADFFRGLPDRLCLANGGKVAFVEVKSKGCKPRDDQQIVHEKLRSMGFDVRVIDSVELADSFISEFWPKTSR